MKRRKMPILLVCRTTTASTPLGLLSIPHTCSPHPGPSAEQAEDPIRMSPLGGAPLSGSGVSYVLSLSVVLMGGSPSLSQVRVGPDLISGIRLFLLSLSVASYDDGVLGLGQGDSA